jgi:prepilin-type N-terminal cleavage/methylation domain-containing protein
MMKLNGQIKAFTLIELLVVVAIIGILSAVGVVAYNGYTKSAKEKVTEANFNNINKALVLEFMKCELDSSELIFNNHSCSNSNAPSTNLIGNYITNNLKIKNPYGTSSAVSTNPCNQGTVSISIPSKGNYSINYYSNSSKKISTHSIGTTWTPVKVTGYTTYTSVKINCTTTYKKVKVTGYTTYTTIKP